MMREYEGYIASLTLLLFVVAVLVVKVAQVHKTRMGDVRQTYYHESVWYQKLWLLFHGDTQVFWGTILVLLFVALAVLYIL